ncbi:unnamed protein product [Coregonus sp. 'balchen']|nr:unnamed protein product [Coregonus sp. 'balchen']
MIKQHSVDPPTAGRVGKRPKQENAQELQEAAVQLLNRHQNLSDLFLEVGSPNPCNFIRKENSGQKNAASERPSPTIGGSLLGEFLGYIPSMKVNTLNVSVVYVLECYTVLNELRRKAGELGVPVAALSVKMVVERLLDLTKRDREQVQLSVLFQSTRELLSLEAFCSKLFWQEYWRDQNGVRSWLMSELRALCGRTATEEGDGVPQQVLSTVVTVLVRAVFEETQDSAAAPCRRLSQVCRSVLDDMLSWVLDTLDSKQTLQSGETAAELWVQMFDASLCGVSVSPDALRRFFTHSLTHTLTYRPRLKVSDAIAMQREWGFAKTCRLLSSLFRKLSVIFKVDELLSHLQQVLETHEVNWQHLLSRLLSSAFEGYDLENMITAFLLARQGALEGPGVFPSYSEWFKASPLRAYYHGNSKKSLVFLLKFLSDLVPFDPPQYLKVHILHPPYVAVKHRALLQEYVSLTKTRLADLKVSIEEMGLYEDISGAGASVQPQCQARQDVEKAISLFGSTGRISATVMEASIFRRPYFLTRFLPALLSPRVLPVKPDDRMNFIDSLKKAEKIPAAQHSSYIESCQRERQRQQDSKGVSVGNDDDNPQEVLQVQLQEHRALLTEGGSDGEVSAQLARISHTLSIVFPERAEELVGQAVIKLHVDESTFPELHNKVVNMILRSFCQSLLDASRISPPNKQSPWASPFVNILLGHRQLLTALLHRMWDLLHNQGASLSAAHVLGLAAFVVHLHASQAQCPQVQLCPPLLPGPVSVPEALTTALPCTTQTNMLFCVRFCVAAVCYGLCRSESLCEQPQQQQYNPCGLYKKLLYLIPRLMPDVRRLPIEASGESEYVGADKQGEEENCGLWKNVTDTNTTWRKSAWALWKHAPFRLLVKFPEYQFSFSEWLAAELRVQRSEDALSDPDRQEYQQWACQQLYLPSPVDQGGCAGDIRKVCSHIFNAVMDQQTVWRTLITDPRWQAPVSQTFCPDFRVILALPAVMLVTVKTGGGKRTLDCETLMEHINQYQRKGCSPAGLLPYHLTAHFLKAVLMASVSCDCPSGEVNKAMSLISLQCPLLLVSAGHWWGRLSPVLVSLWHRLTDGQPLPQQLQVLADCHLWVCSSKNGVSCPVPSAPPLLLAACLHCVWEGQGSGQVIRTSLEMLGQLTEQHRQGVKGLQRAQELCKDILTVLVDSADWLLLFKSPCSEKGLYQPVAVVTSDEYTRLMPLAFYSLVPHLNSEVLAKTVKAPGFLHTAVLCYSSLIKLFMDGQTPCPVTEHPTDQMDPSHILTRAQQVLLKTISLTSPTSVSQHQLNQLEALCVDLDPEVAAALVSHLSSFSLSPELDFL